jgi:uncharacterized protein with HEPN domain
MRREELYLSDIIEAADAIEQFVASLDRDRFLEDDMRRSAVLQKLTIIGEAAARLPKKFRDQYPEIPWGQVVSFRNILVHSYFSIKYVIVWKTAVEEVPALRRQVAQILKQEFGPDSTA